jgi:acyl-CoA thioester hydrolase
MSAAGVGAHQTFSFPLRVYYEDTDAAGIVYYANYLKFIERARTEWLSALGCELAPLEREHGIVFVVHHLCIDYHLPARLGDRLEATVTLTGRRPASITLAQSVLRDGATLTDARVTLACVDRSSFRPARLPRRFAERLENAA